MHIKSLPQSFISGTWRGGSGVIMVGASLGCVDELKIFVIMRRLSIFF